MGYMPRMSGQNGALFAETSQTKVGYSGTTTSAVVGGADNTVDLFDGLGLSDASTGIDNTMYITLKNGATVERALITTYTVGTFTVTVGANFTNSFPIGSTVIIGKACTPNTVQEVVEGVTYAPYAVWTAPDTKINDTYYPVPSIICADGNPGRGFLMKAIQGKVILVPEAAVGDTVDLAYFKANLSQIADFRSWKVDVSYDNVETTAFGETYRSKAPTYRSWSGSLQQVYTNPLFFNLFNNNKFSYVRLVPNQGYNQYWEGKAILTWGINVDYNSAVLSDGKMEGVGPLVLTDF